MTNCLFSESPILIAHGCGGIDSRRYTNSLEALETAIANGYKYIEIDLLESADGILFGGHDYDRFNQITIGKRISDVLTIKQIEERKIYGKYSVLLVDKINEIFAKNPQLILVTDKIRNLDAIVRQIDFPNIEERLIVEVFSSKDYYLALEKGIKYPAYCVSGEGDGSEELNAPIITINITEAEKFENGFVDKNAVLAYTSNSKEQILRMFKKKQATMFYTDFVTPYQLSEEI